MHACDVYLSLSLSFTHTPHHAVWPAPLLASSSASLTQISASLWSHWAALPGQPSSLTSLNEMFKLSALSEIPNPAQLSNYYCVSRSGSEVCSLLDKLDEDEDVRARAADAADVTSREGCPAPAASSARAPFQRAE